MEEINEVTLTIRIDRELHRRLKKNSVVNDLPMKVIISELIEDYLNRKDVKNG